MIDDRQVALTKALMAHYEAIGVSRRHFVKLMGAVGGGVGLSALLAACGGSDSGDSGTGDSGTGDSGTGSTGDSSSGSSSSGSDSPSTGSGGGTGIVVAASGQDISNLDPHVGHDYSIASAQKSVYDTLLRYQGNPPVLENLLATEYEANDDASEWTFKLDERAVFHDGTPVTASDVVYSVGRLLRKNKGPAWMFVNIMDENSASALDDHTVVFKLTTPFAPLPLIMPWLFIVNEKLVKEHEQDGDEGEAWLIDHEAGSGPFTIKRWQVGDSYEFEAVPDYWWGWPAEGRLDGKVWRIIRESSSARLALLNGDAHIAFDLSAEDAAALAKEPDIIVNDRAGLGVMAIKLNNQVGPTSDIQVRKAISYAFDYQAAIDALNGQAIPLEGPLPKALGEFHNPNLDMYTHDMDKAAEELAKSEQYANGGFELEYVYPTGEQLQEQMGLILLDKLSQLNISVKMTPMVWPDMVAQAQDPETTPAMMAIKSGVSYADPDNFLWQAYHSSQAGFWAAASHYKNPEFDKILEEARATSDHDERVKLYHRAQEILVADAVEVWCQSEFARVAWSKKLGGYEYCPIMGHYFQPMYLKS